MRISESVQGISSTPLRAMWTHLIETWVVNHLGREHSDSLYEEVLVHMFTATGDEFEEGCDALQWAIQEERVGRLAKEHGILMLIKQLVGYWDRYILQCDEVTIDKMTERIMYILYILGSVVEIDIVPFYHGMLWPKVQKNEVLAAWEKQHKSVVRAQQQATLFQADRQIREVARYIHSQKKWILPV